MTLGNSFSEVRHYVFFIGSFQNYSWWWIPVVGPHIGAVLGAWVYWLLVEMHWPEDEEETLNGPVGKLNRCSICIFIYNLSNANDEKAAPSRGRLHFCLIWGNYREVGSHPPPHFHRPPPPVLPTTTSRRVPFALYFQ